MIGDTVGSSDGADARMVGPLARVERPHVVGGLERIGNALHRVGLGSSPSRSQTASGWAAAVRPQRRIRPSALQLLELRANDLTHRRRSRSPPGPRAATSGVPNVAVQKKRSMRSIRSRLSEPRQRLADHARRSTSRGMPSSPSTLVVTTHPLGESAVRRRPRRPARLQGSARRGRRWVRGRSA